MGDFSFINTQNSFILLNLLSKYNKYEGQVHFKNNIYLLNNPAQGENNLGYILNLKTPQNNSKDSVQCGVWRYNPPKKCTDILTNQKNKLKKDVIFPKVTA